jgi:hypothetical protein
MASIVTPKLLTDKAKIAPGERRMYFCGTRFEHFLWKALGFEKKAISLPCCSQSLRSCQVQTSRETLAAIFQPPPFTICRIR